MGQNVYDDPAFLAAYSQLDRSVAGLDGAPEWPTLRALLPPLAGRRVVDLGCGFGWFARWAATEGAASVLGLDLSASMLDRARRDTPADLPITYRRADLDTVELAPGSAEIAFSSLAVHYVADLPRLLASVHAALTDDGALVLSAEHPLLTAPRHPRFVPGPDGDPVWPLDGYLDEGPFTADWLGAAVEKQHRTVATYVDALLSAGFVLARLVEWGPSPEQVAARPEWAVERHRPHFLLLAATRR